MIKIVGLMGNLASVSKMIDRVGGNPSIAERPEDLLDAHKIILPGVGSFDYGMEGLKKEGWLQALSETVMTRHIPILGICLGMQLMCRSSEEGHLPGLGWIGASVKRFRFDANTALKIPHMGWNVVNAAKDNPLIPLDREERRYYFVHSYHVVVDKQEDVLGTTNHGGDIVAAFSRGNIFGVQFHPEKSHRFGLELLRRFVELKC